MLLITDDFNGIRRTSAEDHVAEFVRRLATLQADRIVLDAASPDLTNYPSSIGTVNPHLAAADFYAERPDPLSEVVVQLRRRGAEVLANVRMNDHHGRPAQWAEWEREHIEWSLGIDTGARDWKSIGKLRCMDYALPGVREHRLAIVEEILDRFEFDGIQLDFSRTPPFVSNPKEEHARYLTEYVSAVHEMVREKRRGAQGILGAVVPWDLSLCSIEGMEVARWISDGLLDYISPGEKYYTDPNIDLADWRELTRDTDCDLVPIAHGNVSPYQDFEHGEVSALGENGVLDLPKLRAVASNYASQGAEHFGLYNFYTFDFGEIYPDVRRAVDPAASRGSEKHFFYCKRPVYLYREYLAFDRGAAFERYPLMDPGESVSIGFRFSRDPEVARVSMAMAVKHLMPKDRLRIELNGRVLEGCAKRFEVVERSGRVLHVGFLSTELEVEALVDGMNTLAFTVEARAEFREPLEVGELEIR